MMTWEETINFARANKEFSELIKDTYLHPDLSSNVERFRNSDEFIETLKKIKRYNKNKELNILDVGCGNGISSVSFALAGYNVTCIDPDNSDSVGTGAVEKLKNIYGLDRLKIITSSAESFVTSEVYDIVYCRQAMHHANDLNKFIINISTYLKRGGFLFTIRDHVIYNEKDKQRFLEEHPLHKFYNGENAFTSDQYKDAFQRAGLEMREEIRYFDSAINFYPMQLSRLEEKIQFERELISKNLKRRLGWLGDRRWLRNLYEVLIFNPEILRKEASIAGRMYSYICEKA